MAPMPGMWPACTRSDPQELQGLAVVGARCHSSATKKAWKEELSAQLAPQVPAPLPEGPVELQMCFRVGAMRNWTMLWKPAIDSHGCLLGEGPRPFHPNDDRIVRLGLHRVVDASLGYSVDVGIWYTPAPG